MLWQGRRQSSNVEDRRGIGLCAPLAADEHAIVVDVLSDRVERMIDPLVAIGIEVHGAAEAQHAFDVLRPPIDEGSLIVAEGAPLAVAVEQVLAHVRPKPLEEPADMGADGIEASQGVLWLQ